MRYIGLLILTLTVNACLQPLPKGVQTVSFEFENPLNATSAEMDSILLTVIQNRLKSFYPHPVKVQKAGNNQYELLIPGQLGEAVLKPLLATKGKLFFAETLPGQQLAQAFRGAGLIEKLGDKLDLNTAHIQANDPIIGYAEAKDTAMISAKIREADLLGMIAGEFGYAWGQTVMREIPNDNKEMLTLYAIRKVERLYQGIKGKSVKTAKAEVDQAGRWSVMLWFDDAGTEAWANMTEKRVDDFIAILIDGKAWSVPRVVSPITGGQAMISADWNQAYAALWAAVLQGGVLPAKIRLGQLSFDPEGVFQL